MALGTAFELLLLHHYEDVWQLIPLLLIGMSIIIFLLRLLIPSTVIVTIFKFLMISCGLSGVLGIWLHLKANMEFEKELHPHSSGLNLLLETLSGALPALAPGSMIVYAFIGYLYILLILKPSK